MHVSGDAKRAYDHTRQMSTGECCDVLQRVLQRVAACCSVLQHVARYDHTRQMSTGALHCVLQCVAVCCSVLQCVAVCCSVLQCVADHTRQMSRGEYV